MITQLLALGSIMLLASCTNPDPTTGSTRVEGQVVQQQSRQPVGHGTVQVYLASSAGGYRPVGQAEPCDAQGRFSFSFDAERKNGYLLKAEAAPGYITDWTQAPELTAGRSNKGLVVPVLAPAWLKLVLVDEPPKSRVVISINGYDGPGDVLYYPRDTVLIRPILADFKSGLRWTIRENGQEKSETPFVQPGPLDTMAVRIAF